MQTFSEQSTTSDYLEQDKITMFTLFLSQWWPSPVIECQEETIEMLFRTYPTVWR